MKKMMIWALVGLASAAVFAHGGHRGPGFRPGPPPPRHGSMWGRGGSNFWPGFVGGAVAGLVAGAVAQPTAVVVQQPVVPVQVVTPQPVIVQQPVVIQQPVVVQPQPVYQTQNVWVEGRYVDTVNADGTTVRTWQPGHYESRTVRIQ